MKGNFVCYLNFIISTKMKSHLLIIPVLFLFFNCAFSQTVIPVSDELILPQYMIGGTVGGATANRVQFVCRLKLEGLTANSTYRYFCGASNSATLTTTITPGNFFVINNSSGAAGYITGETSSKTMNGTLMSSNEFVTTGRYGEFITDGAGSYTGWFCCVATTNAAFAAGNAVYFYVQLNNGAIGTSIVQAYRTTSTATILDYGTTSGGTNQATGIIGRSFSNNEEMIVLYDNISGTGRPLFVTWTEDDGITTTYTTWYNPAGGNGVEGFPGRWGAIIPNILPNGLLRTERRAINNTLIDFSTSLNGSWGALNTVNPSGGTSPLIIDSTAAPLPVQLSSFTSIVNKNSVMLNWKTTFEINNRGFQLERQNSGNNAPGTWQELSFINGNGNSNQLQNYNFEDKNLNLGTYKYRLKQIDYNGNSEYFNLTSEVIIGKPSDFSVSQNFPNPFNPSTNILYSLPDDSFIQLRIYDVSGRLVTELLNGAMEKGYHSVEFNGTNLASGIYFYHLLAKGNGDKILYTKIMKMLLVK
jgi:hypothetical protein